MRIFLLDNVNESTLFFRCDDVIVITSFSYILKELQLIRNSCLPFSNRKYKTGQLMFTVKCQIVNIRFCGPYDIYHNYSAIIV